MTGFLLLVLSLLFASPALLPANGQALGEHDMRGLFFPWLSAARGAIRQGDLPLWESRQFNGYPFLSNPQVGFFYPPTWLAFLLPLQVGISWHIVLHIWLAAAGMLLFVRELKGSWLGVVLAAIAFGFSGLVAARIWAEHIGVLATVAWMPWLLAALHWSARQGGIWSAVVAGLPFGLAILAGHPPTFIYAAFIWFAFVLYLIMTSQQSRRLVVRQAALMAVVGCSIAAVQLLPFLQAMNASQRVADADFEFASNYSLPPAHLVTVLVPEFFGEPVRSEYWSVPTFEELSYYAGLLTVLGLVLALRRPTRLTWFLIGLMILGLWLALGRYGALYQVLFNIFPPFRVMRAPRRAAILYLVSATVLLGVSLTRWQREPPEWRRQSLGALLRWTLALSGVIGMTALVTTGAVFMAIHPTDTSGRLWHQLGGYAWALTALLIGGGLLWSFLITPSANNQRRLVLGAALIVLVTADLWQFGLKFIRLESMGPLALWLDAKEVVGETEARVLPWGLSIFGQNGGMQVGLNSVFGYDPLVPASHLALTDSVPDPRSSAYDVIGAAYVISEVPLDQFAEGDAPLTLLDHRGEAWVYRRSRPMPVIRLVYQAEIIGDDSAAIDRIHSPEFDPSVTAILDKEPTCRLGPAPSEPGSTDILEARDGYWRISTSSTAPAILLAAETSYPGWTVTVDGDAARPLTAYTTIRGVCVPAGEHVVEWIFRPTIFIGGGAITLLSLILLGVAVAKLLADVRTAAN